MHDFLFTKLECTCRPAQIENLHSLHLGYARQIVLNLLQFLCCPLLIDLYVASHVKTMLRWVYVNVCKLRLIIYLQVRIWLLCKRLKCIRYTLIQTSNAGQSLIHVHVFWKSQITMKILYNFDRILTMSWTPEFGSWILFNFACGSMEPHYD
jgi:hypothetical protein